MEQARATHGIGPTRRRSMCEKDCARAKTERDTASEESKAKEKESDRLRRKRCIQRESHYT